MCLQGRQNNNSRTKSECFLCCLCDAEKTHVACCCKAEEQRRRTWRLHRNSVSSVVHATQGGTGTLDPRQGAPSLADPGSTGSLGLPPALDDCEVGLLRDGTTDSGSSSLLRPWGPRAKVSQRPTHGGCRYAAAARGDGLGCVTADASRAASLRRRRAQSGSLRY